MFSQAEVEEECFSQQLRLGIRLSILGCFLLLFDGIDLSAKFGEGHLKFLHLLAAIAFLLRHGNYNGCVNILIIKLLLGFKRDNCPQLKINMRFGRSLFPMELELELQYLQYCSWVGHDYYPGDLICYYFVVGSCYYFLYGYFLWHCF
jgi:hypothetical protein